MKGKLQKIFTLGEIQGENEWLRLKMEHLERHICIWGSTGTCKTMIALSLMRQLFSQGIGFTFITPHPDGREKLLHWADLNKIDPGRIVDCTPGTDCCVSLDPFANMPKGLNRLQEETWLQAECKRVMSAIMSNVPLADQEVMNQLNTWMMNSLYLCGKRVDGEYLGLQKALMLFDVDHPEHEPTMNRLLPVVPDYMRADWNMYRGTKNVTQRRLIASSTVNRYRRSIFCNPIVLGMFAKSEKAVNDEEINENSMIQVVSVPESDDLPREAGITVARMRLSSGLGAAKRIAMRVPERKRKYHFYIMDEFEVFITEEARTGFQESRKFRTPFMVMMQGTSCAQKGEMDLLSKVTNECGIQCTGQQQDPESLDYLSDAFSAPFLNHTPLIGLQALPVGHEMLQTQSMSFNSSEGISVSQADAMTQSRSVTKGRTVSQSTQNSVSLALSSTHSEGVTDGASRGGSTGVSQGENWSKRTGTSENVTESEAKARSRQRSRSNTVGESEGTAETESTALSQQEGKSNGTTKSRQNNWSESNGTSQNDSTGKSEGRSDGDGRSRVIGEFHDTVNRNSGRNSGQNESHGTGSNQSQSSGGSEGEGESSSINTSTGLTSTKGRTANRSTSRTAGETEGEGETETHGRSVGRGRQESEGVGGSLTTSDQKNWTENRGKSSTDAKGVTKTIGGSTGTSSGESSGESNGQSVGHTDSLARSLSNGVAVSFNQVPLALTEILEIRTGRLVVSVPDQISMFKQCIASLPDRMMLVKVRGMNRPFLLKTHTVHDPYEQKGLLRCTEWRELLLKQYVAKIRKAHPWYFLPSLDEPEPAPEPKKDDKRKKRKLEEVT